MNLADGRMDRVDDGHTRNHMGVQVEFCLGHHTDKSCN